MKKEYLPKISVIVINYNGRHFLKECFESLKKVNYTNYDVFLMDNCSTDGSVDYVKKEFTWVKILAFKKNYAVAEGYNLASQEIKTEYLYFLNNDTKVDKSFLKEAIKPMLKDNKVAVCGSKMYFYDKPQYLNYAGGKITPIGGGFEEGFNQKDTEEFDRIKTTGLACGGAMLVRRSKFIEAGMFDPSYVIYFEDVDLCWRLWLYGYKVMYVPTSIVYHKYGGFFGGFNKSAKSVYLAQKNRLKNLFKNAEFKTIVCGLFLSFCYDIAKSLYFIFHLRFGRLFSLLKGNIHFLFGLSSVIGKRKEVQSLRKLSDRELKNKCIIASGAESVKVYLKFTQLKWQNAPQGI